MKLHFLPVVVIAAALPAMLNSAAAEQFNGFEKPQYNYGASDFDRAMTNAQGNYDRSRTDAAKEAMRDKSHDFPRWKVGDGESIGGDYKDGQPSVNYRISK